MSRLRANGGATGLLVLPVALIISGANGGAAAGEGATDGRHGR